MTVRKMDVVEQYLDNNGALLNAGLIYTYITTSSTPLATYTDATGGSAHTNPIVLDSSGRTDIWFTEGSSYKVIIKTSAGVTLDTIDALAIPTSASSSTTYVDIAFEVLDATPPTASQALGGYTHTQAVTFPINFAGSKGKVLASGTNPTATFTAIVKKNGTQCGTLVISTGGAFTFTTTGAATVSFAVGDLLEIYGPVTPDANLVLFCWTFRGTAA